jgi:hypothetical protein
MNIIELAKQANGEPARPGGVDWAWGELEAFAALVAAHEREECAKLFETITKDPAVPPVHFSLFDTAKLIRARGTT